jgi:type II secretory pathway pseudopilin PulG
LIVTPAPGTADAPLPAADVLAAIAADATADAARPFVELVAAYFAAAGAGQGPVSTAQGPAALAARFAEPLPRGGRPLAEVAERLARDVVADANRLCHPMYLGHQVSAPLPAAVWTDALVAALNQSVAVAEMSPTGTAVEGRVVRWMAELAGFGRRAGGTFTSGGTEATFAALLAARSRAVPTCGQRGSVPSRRWWCAASTRTTPWRAPPARWASASATWSPCRRATCAWTPTRSAAPSPTSTRRGVG